MPSLNPYLSFKNDARSAMEFYQSVFGGDLDISTFGSFEGMVEDPSENDLVMHAQLTTPDGFILMASDTPSRMEYVATRRHLGLGQRRRRAQARGLLERPRRRRLGRHAVRGAAVGRTLRDAARQVRHRLDGVVQPGALTSIAPGRALGCAHV